MVRILIFYWSVVSYPISQLQSPGRVECSGFSLSHQQYQKLYRRKHVFRFTVFSFWLELCNKIQISKRKGNKDTNMYISCILLRNAGINNSKRWLEFGLTDHLNQRTVYNQRNNYREEKSSRLPSVSNFGVINTFETNGRQ